MKKVKEAPVPARAPLLGLLLPLLLLLLPAEGAKLAADGDGGGLIDDIPDFAGDLSEVAGDTSEVGAFEDGPAAWAGEQPAASAPGLELAEGAGDKGEGGQRDDVVGVSVDLRSPAPPSEAASAAAAAAPQRFLAPRPANAAAPAAAHASPPDPAKPRSQAWADKSVSAGGQLPMPAAASVDVESSARGSAAGPAPASARSAGASLGEAPGAGGDGSAGKVAIVDAAAGAAPTDGLQVGDAQESLGSGTADDMVLAAKAALYGSDQQDEPAAVDGAAEEAVAEVSGPQNGTEVSEDRAGSKVMRDELSFIHGRLAKAEGTAALLRKKLVAAWRSGASVKQELATSREQLAKEKAAAAQELAQKDGVDQSALALERHKEEALEARLNQSQAVLSRRDAALGRMRVQLLAEQKQLAEARASSQAKEEAMQRDLAKEKQQSAARDATARSLAAAKTAAENEQTAAQHKDAEALKKAKDEAAKMKAVALKTGRLLKQERARSKTLQELVEVNKHKVVEYMGEESQLRTDLSSANSASHNVTLQLQDALQRQQDLSRERDALVGELQGNASQASNSSAQVAQLRHQLEEEQKARGKAEAAANKAESEKNAAQAIAKQLSEVMPQLLEQAESAHEACDANKAQMQKIQDLRQQYTSIIQHEQEQLQIITANAGMPPNSPGEAALTTVAPREDVSTVAPNEDMTLVMEDSEELDKADQDGSLAKAASS